MFSLIIAIVSIALVVAVVAAGSYFGGTSMTEARAQTEATRLKNEEQQILASMDLFNADNRRWPDDVQELVSKGYLKSVPQGALMQAQLDPQPARELLASFLPAAHADALAASGWGMPVSRQPIFSTAMKVPKLVCQKFNMVSRGDDGILRKPFEELRAQCYGEADNYQVVVRKQAAALSLADAIAPVSVAAGGMPSADAGTSWWDTPPNAGVKGVVDPDKVPYAKLALHAGSVPLGNVQVGHVRTSASITVVNDGNAVASAVSVSAPDGFSVVDSTCGTSLGIGGSCKFAVTFTPAEAREYSGALSVASTNGGVQTATVAGTGVSANAYLGDVAFGNLAAAATVERDATIFNNGIDTLSLGAPSVSGAGFVLAASTCGSSLAAGDSCSFKIRLTGAGVTLHTGQLSVQTEAGLKTAALSGQSQAAILAITPATSTFADTELSKFTDGTVHTIRNNGNLAQSPLSIVPPTGFALNTNTCPVSLAPAAQCTVNFRFSPTLVKDYSGTVTVTGTSGITLVAKGVTQVASLNNVDFGQVPYGNYGYGTATLANNGAIPLTVSAISASNITGANFALSSTTCGASLAVGASCTVTMSYYAPTLAAATGTLTLNYGGGTLVSNLAAVGKWSGSDLGYNGAVFGGGGPQINAAYGNYGTSASPFRFANTTGRVLTGVTFNFTAYAAYFSIVSSTCGSTIQIGEVCNFYIRFYNPSPGVQFVSTVYLSASGYTSNTSNFFGYGN